jgi:hypothetical protein
MADGSDRRGALARDVEREAREFLNYQLLPLREVLAHLEDGVAPAFSRRLLLSPHELPSGRTARRNGAPGLAEADPELFAAVERLRRTPWFRLRFAWAQFRRGG